LNSSLAQTAGDFWCCKVQQEKWRMRELNQTSDLGLDKAAA